MSDGPVVWLRTECHDVHIIVTTDTGSSNSGVVKKVWYGTGGDKHVLETYNFRLEDTLQQFFDDIDPETSSETISKVVMAIYRLCENGIAEQRKLSSDDVLVCLSLVS